MNIKWCIYLIILFSAATVGIAKWKILQTPDKIVALLVSLTFASELTALLTSRYWHNNLPVYHIYSPLSFLLISLYFNYSIELFRKRRIGIIWGTAGVGLSIIDTLYLEKIDKINSYYLLFQGTTIIIYGLLSIRQILLDEDYLPYKFALFWITILFMIYWSITFTIWGFYVILSPEDAPMYSIFDVVLTTANFILYGGITIVFLLYRRLIPSSYA